MFLFMINVKLSSLRQSLPIVVFTKQLLSILQIVQNLFTVHICDISCLRLVAFQYCELFTLCAVRKSEKLSEKVFPVNYSSL